MIRFGRTVLDLGLIEPLCYSISAARRPVAVSTIGSLRLIAFSFSSTLHLLAMSDSTPPAPDAPNSFRTFLERADALADRARMTGYLSVAAGSAGGMIFGPGSSAHIAALMGGIATGLYLDQERAKRERTKKGRSQ